MNRPNPAVAKLDMPERIKKLPIDRRGYPVPKFVAWLNGEPDFRAVRPAWVITCIKKRLCWLCGEPMGRFMTFVIGPMCSVNRVSSEPPSHLDCARFAVKACPFLVQPARSRNEIDLPEQRNDPAGIMIARNPGVALVWVTKTYRPFRTSGGVGNSGLLLQLGDPVNVEWYARGRTATREEIMASINTGLPALREVAGQEGPAAIAELDKLIAQGLALVPA